MLSTKDGNPVAKVVGNPEYDLILVKMEEEPKPRMLKKTAKKKLSDFADVKYAGRKLDLSDSDMDSDDDIYSVLSEDEINRVTKSTRKLDKSYYPEKKMKKMKEKLRSQISIHEGFMTPVPNLEAERDVLYVAGPSGSGKSTYVRRYLLNYLRMFPDRMINIFSCVSADKAFDDLPNVNRIVIDASLALYNMEDFAESCVVFDDIDVIADNKIKAMMQNLRDQTLEIGRHNKITVCATSHQLTNYKATRVLLNEATSVTVFPKTGASYHIKRWCTVYAGLSAKATQKILDLPSRWVTITRTAPMFVLYEKGVIMLNSL